MPESDEAKPASASNKIPVPVLVAHADGGKPAPAPPKADPLNRRRPAQESSSRVWTAVAMRGSSLCQANCRARGKSCSSSSQAPSGDGSVRSRPRKHWIPTTEEGVKVPVPAASAKEVPPAKAVAHSGCREQDRRGCEWGVEIAAWCPARPRFPRAAASTLPATPLPAPTGKKKKERRKPSRWRRKIFVDTGAANRWLRSELLLQYVSHQKVPVLASRDEAPLPRETMLALPQVKNLLPQMSSVGSVKGFTRDGVLLTYMHRGTRLKEDKKQKQAKVRHGAECISWSLLAPEEAPRFDSENSSVKLTWRIYVAGAHANSAKKLANAEDGAEVPSDAVLGELQAGALEVALTIREGDKVNMELGPARDRQDRAPIIRRLFLTDQLAICVEHRRPEATLDCFCADAIRKASSIGMVSSADTVVRWGSAGDYATFWMTVVEMEAATMAVDDNISKLIHGVDITWLDKRRGTFKLPYLATLVHNLRFRSLLKGGDGLTEWSSGWLCIRQQSSNPHLQGDWNAHGAVTEVLMVTKDGQQSDLPNVDEQLWTASPKELGRLSGVKLLISFKLMSGSSPDEEVSMDCMVEYFPKAAPFTYQAMSLLDLPEASSLAKQVLLSATVPLEVSPNGTDLSDWELNPSQEKAVRMALEEPLALVHGPPGTGKTRMAATLAALYALQNMEEPGSGLVLYCAPSNDMADLSCLTVQQLFEEHLRKREAQRFEEATACATAFLSESPGNSLDQRQQDSLRSLLQEPVIEGLNAIRIYSMDIERTDFPVPRKFDNGAFRWVRTREVPEELRKHAMHWRCHGVAPGVEPTPEAQKCGRLYAELLRSNMKSPLFPELRREYCLALAKARIAELRKADIVFSTCASSRSKDFLVALRGEGVRKITQVIVDEAAQVSEPDTMGPLLLSKDVNRIALIGDPKQLRPIVRSPAAKLLGLGVSLLERLSCAPQANSCLLSLQYRMHPALNDFPSGFFYQGQVATDTSVAIREAGLLAHPEQPGGPMPVIVWDTKGDNCLETHSLTKTTYCNPMSHANVGEAQRAVRLAKKIVRRAQEQDRRVSVGVLSWYNAQVSICSARLADLPEVHVGSVVSAQGSEFDYVILSTVRTGTSKLGVVGDVHFFNVALTRARVGLCIIGCVKVLKTNNAWNAFLCHCEDIGAMCQSMPHVLSKPVGGDSSCFDGSTTPGGWTTGDEDSVIGLSDLGERLM